MPGKWRWLTIFLAASLTTASLGLVAGAEPATESEFLDLINSSRAAAGLAPLKIDDGLRSHARKHTQDMMDAGELYHSSAEELRAAAGTGWTKVGENVGRGGTPPVLHEAFMNSDAHRANILGDYNYVGIGTGTKDGTLYVTVVFMAKETSTTTTTTTASSPATTAAAKAPATTTATTTTTTLIVGPDKPITPGEACLSATRFGWLCHD
ncbi:MAG TPA: CAP domain-containing protein [Acidimicrobiia bacterium]|nr:CAP domain-containing protein [Acidimicrobiia bacterium]